MTLYFLKFQDEAEAIETLADFRGQDQEGRDVWLTYKDGVNLDIVGTIYKPTGNMLEVDGTIFPEMAPVDGFHVNYLADELPKVLQPFSVTPTNPVRIYA